MAFVCEEARAGSQNLEDPFRFLQHRPRHTWACVIKKHRMRTPYVLLVSAVIALLIDVAVAAGVIYRTWGYLSAALVACMLLAYYVSTRPLRARASTSQEPAIHGGSAGRERMLQAYAESVAKSLRGLYGRSCAFVLVATPLGEAPAAVQYVSNLERRDGTELLRRLLASWQAFGRDADPAGAHGIRRIYGYAARKCGAGVAQRVPAGGARGARRSEPRSPTAIAAASTPSARVVNDLARRLRRSSIAPSPHSVRLLYGEFQGTSRPIVASSLGVDR